MRLLTVFLIISITYGQMHHGMESANYNNETQLQKFQRQSPEHKHHTNGHHVPFGDVYKEGFQPHGAAPLKTADDNDPFMMDGKNNQRYYPVPFGHIFKEGFDPLGRDPVDMLELGSYYVKAHPLIQQLEAQSMALPIEKPKAFLSPKDEFYFGKKQKKEVKKKTKPDKMYLDFAGQHLRNVRNQKSRNPTLREVIAQRNKENSKNMNLSKDLVNEHKGKSEHFAQNTFQIKGMSKNKKKDNITWTTCKEFGKKTDFHPKDIVDVDWIPFYIWSGANNPKKRAGVHKFSYPTKKIVNYYKESYGPLLKKPVDWEQPKLLFKESIEALLIAVGRRGLFDAIPFIELPDKINSNIVVPQLQIWLKIVDPYLAMMICDVKYAVIMANPGNEPIDYEDIITEANTLKFKGIGNPVERDFENEKRLEQINKEMEMKRERKIKLKDYIQPKRNESHNSFSNYYNGLNSNFTN